MVYTTVTINETVTIWGNSLSDYSQVMTSICERKTDFIEHSDESASVQPKLVDTKPPVVPLDDAAQVLQPTEMATTGVTVSHAPLLWSFRYKIALTHSSSHVSCFQTLARTKSITSFALLPPSSATN